MVTLEKYVPAPWLGRQRALVAQTCGSDGCGSRHTASDSGVDSRRIERLSHPPETSGSQHCSDSDTPPRGWSDVWHRWLRNGFQHRDRDVSRECRQDLLRPSPSSTP